MPKGSIESVSVEPLVRVVETMASDGEGESDLSNSTFATMVGFSTRTIVRWREAGRVPWTKADVAAVRLGLHPINVWGDEWLDLDADHIADEIAQEAQETLDAVTS